MTYKTGNAPTVPAKTRALMEQRGKDTGLSVEWEIGGDSGLTMEEMEELRAKHGTRNVNYTRAARVKELMLKGKKCIEIVGILRNEYGERMVKTDHAALSPLLGRGVAKRGVRRCTALAKR